MSHGESTAATDESSRLLSYTSSNSSDHTYNSIDGHRPPSSNASSNAVAVNKLFNSKEDATYSWGGTPGLRKLWTSYPSSNVIDSDETNTHNIAYSSDYSHSTTKDNLISDDTLNYIDVEVVAHQASEEWKHMKATEISSTSACELPVENTMDYQRGTGLSPTDNSRSVNCIADTFVGAPGVVIAVVLNLFMSMSFGQAFFPSDFSFPTDVPRSIGVQMFLFSTIIGQLVMTQVSDFPSAMGMMMVENIPFMHIIAEICISATGKIYAVDNYYD